MKDRSSKARSAGAARARVHLPTGDDVTPHPLASPTGTRHEKGASTSAEPEFEIAEPRAGALVEALRSVGYSVQTAIADLVDNSITARAKHVDLVFMWVGTDSWISLTDDGVGMTSDELFNAMRAGARNPLQERAATDLGRFGLGLKTASFSQARRLTVASKRKGGPISVKRWDLDYVGATGEWRLLNGPAPRSADRIAQLRDMPSGTVVLWEVLDRLVGDRKADDRHAHDHFLATVKNVREHLAMVFHQYLTGKSKLSLSINGRSERDRVSPWDPFCESHFATFSPSDAERIAFGAGAIMVKGFVLPHKDRLTAEEHRLAGGPAGWHAQQGFYVYRNRRLLVAGSWLDLGFTSEDIYKLARIRIEIPNDMDAAWSIDVKKSRARPPAVLRARLREIANVVRTKAREVYAHRGRRSGGNATTEPLRRAWLPTMRDGKLHYTVDRGHALTKLVLNEATPTQRTSIEAMLRLLEATIPVQQIWLDAAEQPDRHGTPFEGETPAHVRTVMLQLYRALRADGISPSIARQRISTMEPFNAMPALVGTLDDIEY